MTETTITKNSKLECAMEILLVERYFTVLNYQTLKFQFKIQNTKNISNKIEQNHSSNKVQPISIKID